MGTLEDNKREHVKIYKEASEGFRKKYIENVESFLDRAKNGGKVHLHINMIEPENHVEDYERAIEMLEWDEDTTVYLTEQEFQNYVQNKWGWTRSFTQSNAPYAQSLHADEA